MARPGKSGGFKFHKPDCQCYPCVAQRRQKEALAQPAGAGGGTITVPDRAVPASQVIDADAPITIEGTTPRDRILQFVAIRATHPELTHADIARKLGISPRHMYNLITQATKAGWLRFSDPTSRIEHEIIPKVVDNLSMFLDQKNERVTIETAKGTIFRKYQDEQGISDAAQTVLALKIEIPDMNGPVKVVTGRIVGRAKELPDAIPE